MGIVILLSIFFILQSSFCILKSKRRNLRSCHCHVLQSPVLSLDEWRSGRRSRWEAFHLHYLRIDIFMDRLLGSMIISDSAMNQITSKKGSEINLRTVQYKAK